MLSTSRIVNSFFLLTSSLQICLAVFLVFRELKKIENHKRSSLLRQFKKASAATLDDISVFTEYVSTYNFCSKDLKNLKFIVGSRGAVVLVLWVLGSVVIQLGYSWVHVPSAKEYNDEGEVSLGIYLAK